MKASRRQSAVSLILHNVSASKEYLREQKIIPLSEV